MDSQRQANKSLWTGYQKESLHALGQERNHQFLRFLNGATVREIPNSAILINVKTVAILTPGYFINCFYSKQFFSFLGKKRAK